MSQNDDGTSIKVRDVFAGCRLGGTYDPLGGNVHAYQAPFPDAPWRPAPVWPYPESWPPPQPVVQPIVTIPPSSLPLSSPLTEEDVRRIIREELQRFDEMMQERHDAVMRSAKPLDQVLCMLGTAHLLEDHPQNEQGGGD